MQPRDPLEVRMEVAFRPGRMVRSEEERLLVHDLGTLCAEIDALVEADPPRAQRLTELMLAGCHEKSAEVEEAEWCLGTLVADLVALWLRARRARGAPVRSSLEQILGWRRADPYGIFRGIETAILPTLDDDESLAFRELIRARFASALSEPDDPERSPDKAEAVALLKAIQDHRGDAPAYVGLCERYGLERGDALVASRLLDESGDPQGALRWIRRGLDLVAGADHLRFPYRLQECRLLSRAGQTEEALTLAWGEFVHRPSSSTLEGLLEIAPEASRATWERRALDHVEGGPLEPFFEVALALGAHGALAKRVLKTPQLVLRSESHLVTQPIAEALEADFPQAAAILSEALALRILDAGKSPYYEAALDHLDRARDCYRRCGHPNAWILLVNDIQSRHGRKYAFMPGFRRLRDSRGRTRAPTTYLETALANWKHSLRARPAP